MSLPHPKVTFMSQNVPLPEIDSEQVERWLNDVILSHGKIMGELTYIFCDDERILEVNKEFLQHDYYTDIITFDYSRGKLVRGDIFISLDTVRSNAELVGAAYNQEFYRVVVHGVLHLCGIDDKGPSEREIMERFENQALEMLDKRVVE